MRPCLFGLVYAPWLLLTGAYEWAADKLDDDWADFYYR